MSPTTQASGADTRVWVRTGSAMVPFKLIDARPVEADELGHSWAYDGGASDLDAPYTCRLCLEPQWRAYRTPCAAAGQLEAYNAERAAHIAEHRCERPTGVNRLGYVVSDFASGRWAA